MNKAQQKRLAFQIWKITHNREKRQLILNDIIIDFIKLKKSIEVSIEDYMMIYKIKSYVYYKRREK